MAAVRRSFREHFLAPSGRGEIDPSGGEESVGEAENQVCGDWVRFHLRLEAGRIADARMQVRGCSATIACASIAVEALAGLEPEAALLLDVHALAEAAGATPRQLSHAPWVVKRAIRETLAKLP